MIEVRVFIESTWRGPAKRDGVAMWLVECIKDGVPVTRQGFVHVKNGTETQGNLMAIINVFFLLKKSCSALVFTKCERVLHTLQNQWHIQWEKNGWKNAKGKPIKEAELWEMLMEKAEPHVYTLRDGWHEYQNLMQSAVQKELEAWKEKGD